MATLTHDQIEKAVRQLDIGLVTAEHVRPSGVHDDEPPHEKIKRTFLESARDTFEALEHPAEKLPQRLQQHIQRLNHYLHFACDPKSGNAEYYREHQNEIEGVAYSIQDNALARAVDRQLIWRAQQQIAEDKKQDTATPNPVINMYIDTAIAHNAGYINGELQRAIQRNPNAKRLEAGDFVGTFYTQIQNKCQGAYDPTVSGVSTFFESEAKWIISRGAHGRGHQERFEKGQQTGFLAGTTREGTAYNNEPYKRFDRREEVKLDIFGASRNPVMREKLKETIANIASERDRALYSYKLDHPDMPASEVAKHFKLTKQRVYQIYNELEQEIIRIAPKLAVMCEANAVREGNQVVLSDLECAEEAPEIQQRVHATIEAAKKDLGRMIDVVGKDHITVTRFGEMRVSAAATRGNNKLKAHAHDIKHTHQVIQTLQKILDSPYQDAGFDVLDRNEIRRVAFYHGGSDTLEAFACNHIEALATEARKKTEKAIKGAPAKKRVYESAVDTYYASTEDDLNSARKKFVNEAFDAIQGSDGSVLDADDLMLLRQLAHSKDIKQAIELAI